MWLWPPLIQQELDKFRHYANNHRVRKQKDKILPSGVSPNMAYLFPEKFGATNCLEPVDLTVVQEILDGLQEEKERLTDWGVPEEFAARAKTVYDTLPVEEVTLLNIWLVFALMAPRLTL